MKSLFRPEHIWIVAILGILVVGTLSGWDITALKTAVAPILPASVLHPSKPGTQIIDNGSPAAQFYNYVEVTKAAGHTLMASALTYARARAKSTLRYCT